jgi:hypothetical protein
MTRRTQVRAVAVLIALLAVPAQAGDAPLSTDLRTAFATAAGVTAAAVTEVAEHPFGTNWASTKLHSVLIGAWVGDRGSEAALVVTRRCGDGRCAAQVLKLGRASQPAVVALVDLEGDGGEITENEWEAVLEPIRDETATRPALLLRLHHAAPAPSTQRGLGLLVYSLGTNALVWDRTARVSEGGKTATQSRKLVFERGPGPILDIVTGGARFRWDDGTYKPLK